MWAEGKYDMIERPFYIEKIKPYIDKNIIKVLVGIRRSGKSFIMMMVKDLLKANGIDKTHIIEANFESKALPFDKTADGLYAYVKARAGKSRGRRLYLLLDEIQEVEGWEKVVDAFTVDFPVDVYLTGSNAKLLSGELATHLSGRYVEIRVYPLSFAETLPCYRALSPGISEQDAFMRYVKDGGMPFVHDAHIFGEVFRAYMSDVFNSVLLKDIAQRRKLRDTDLLEKILMYLVSEIGHEFSAPSLSKYLRHEGRTVAPETLYNYVRYAAEACFSVELKRNDVAGKRILSSRQKVYLSDHGFREAIFGNNEARIDQVLDNIVAVDLVRRGYGVTVGTVGAKEVDFIAQRGSERIYVQVAYLMPTVETREREFSSLEQIRDNYPKYVLSLDMPDFSRNGIVHRRIHDFLLDR